MSKDNNVGQLDIFVQYVKDNYDLSYCQDGLVEDNREVIIDDFLNTKYINEWLRSISKQCSEDWGYYIDGSNIYYEARKPKLRVPDNDQPQYRTSEDLHSYEDFDRFHKLLLNNVPEPKTRKGKGKKELSSVTPIGLYRSGFSFDTIDQNNFSNEVVQAGTNLHQKLLDKLHRVPKPVPFNEPPPVIDDFMISNDEPDIDAYLRAKDLYRHKRDQFDQSGRTEPMNQAQITTWLDQDDRSMSGFTEEPPEISHYRYVNGMINWGAHTNAMADYKRRKSEYEESMRVQPTELPMFIPPFYPNNIDNDDNDDAPF